MCEALRTAFFNFFPLPQFKSPERYRIECSSNPAYDERLSALRDATKSAALEQQKHLCEYAEKYVASEQERATSIIARAQALLVAQTYFGALLALATALMGHTEFIGGQKTYFLGALLVYIIFQIVLLTLNAIRATSGLNYSAPGVTPLVDWMPKSELLFLRHMGLELIRSYWQANIANTWRVNHLSLAQKSLRNIVFASAFLVLVLMIFVFQKPPAALYELPPV
jgi:hypothetical protein